MHQRPHFLKCRRGFTRIQQRLDVIENLHPDPPALKRAISREKKAPAKVLAHEGGYSNNKKDPGGPTMKGVHGGRSARRN
ncbi:hypothetical protein NKI89_31035 [Mesorhizobium sp. M0309]|uniref:glycosyl hydrolase 108 family protein n=1 Tax=Mesorhizobium sp. M0309 TaxID=2956933 RepID=UPI00333533AF